MRVEEAAYGRSSIKLLDRLDKLARWYEADAPLHQRAQCLRARARHPRARARPKTTCGASRPLRGIARSFRLEAFYGVEGADTGATFNSGNSRRAGVHRRHAAAARRELADDRARRSSTPITPVNQQMRGEVLTDLGDWYLVTNALRRAYDTYADAWKAFASVSNTKTLEAPRMLAYRPSISSVDRSQLDPAEAVIKVVELHFKVDRDGRIDEVTSPTTDVPENIVRNSRGVDEAFALCAAHRERRRGAHATT